MSYQEVRKPPLKPTQAHILAYGSSTPLTLDGQCLCEIQHHNGVSRYLRFFVLAGNAELILGLSAYEQFSLIRRLCCTDLKDVPISPDIPAPQVHQNVAVEDPVNLQICFKALGFWRNIHIPFNCRRELNPMLWPAQDEFHTPFSRKSRMNCNVCRMPV